MRELTVRALVTGVFLGIVFGASSLYLALKVGLTVTASIPVAVISFAGFRGASKFGLRDATVLENNITQTAGSAGESIAFGVAVTMPAIMILGFDLQVSRIIVVSVLGSLMGILMMIPLRRPLIVDEHETLKYPEGTACAAVLAAGSDVGAAAKGSGFILAGVIGGAAAKILNVAVHAWKEVAQFAVGPPSSGLSVGLELSPELLGVGYIVGPRISARMFAGGIFASLVLAPLVKYFGGMNAGPLAPGTMAIASMSSEQIRSSYLLYIGAGAVAAGGVISMVRALPTLYRAFAANLRRFFGPGLAPHMRPKDRTDLDLPLWLVATGILSVVIGITSAPALQMNVLGASLVIVFGFLFVSVSSRLTGEIGSSANPVSGMTVATLLLTCLIFLSMGRTGREYYVTALSIGAVVCIAASNAGHTSQDLKTGYLLGATPRSQQIAIICGALTSALVIGPILLRLNEAATVYVPAGVAAHGGLRADPAVLGHSEGLVGPQAEGDGRLYRVWWNTDPGLGLEGKYLMDDRGLAIWYVDPGINGRFTRRPDGSEVRKFDAPKALLMSYIIKGILGRRLPWALVLVGAMVSLVLEMVGVPSLAFAVGVYLPISSSSPIWIGGMVRKFSDWRRSRTCALKLTPADWAKEGDRGRGVLLASGYIAGGATAGIAAALLAGLRKTSQAGSAAPWQNPFYNGPHSDVLSLLPFAVLVVALCAAGRAPAKGGGTEP